MEVLKNIYIVVLYLNFPLAAASFFFAAILLHRAYTAIRAGRHDPIYFNFGMAVLFLGIYISSTLALFYPWFDFPLTWMFNFSIFTGTWILNYFYIFTLFYPYPVPTYRKNKIFAYVATILISLTYLIPGLYAQSVSRDFPFLSSKYNPAGLTIFSTYFVVVAILGFKNLIDKYRNLDGFLKSNLRKIIVGTFIAMFGSLTLSTDIYYFTNFNTTPFGTLFIFAVIAYIYSIMFGGFVRINIGHR